MTDNFNAFSNNIDMYTLLRGFQQETLARINCMRIGIIEEILIDNEVKCSITNKKLMSINNDGTGIYKEYPPIYAKIYYMGGQNVNINYPLKTGDACLLLFNDREFESFFTTGKISTLSDTRLHSMNDAICIPFYNTVVVQDGDLNINNIGGTLNITADTVNLNATTININGVLNINGQPYLSHTHTLGFNGNPTGGIII